MLNRTPSIIQYRNSLLSSQDTWMSQNPLITIAIYSNTSKRNICIIKYKKDRTWKELMKSEFYSRIFNFILETSCAFHYFLYGIQKWIIITVCVGCWKNSLLQSIVIQKVRSLILTQNIRILQYMNNLYEYNILLSLVFIGRS